MLPAMIMLTAGAINCVISIIERLSMLAFTKRLLLVLVLFYVLGCVVKLIVDVNFPQMEDAPALAEDAAEPGAEALEEAAERGMQESGEKLENINAEHENH